MKQILRSVVITALLLAQAITEIGSLTVIRAQQSTTFTSTADFLSATPEEVRKKFRLQPLDLSQSLDRMICEEVKALNRVTGFETQVWITEGASAISHPDVGVAVSRQQLDRIRRESNVRQFREILRFILAHEMSHQVQYRQYSKRAFYKELGYEERSIYECQADLLAGKYLIETLTQVTPESQQAIQDALKVAFDLGTEEYSLADHPSHESRRTAVKLGMASGMITNFSRLPSDPSIAGNVAGSMSVLAQKIDIAAGETVMNWSFRQAKRTIRYSRQASPDIVLEDQQIEWDKRATNPFVKFSLTYKNTGSRRISVDMEVQCVSVPRDASNDTLRWQKWSSKNFRFSLRPGEQFTANGTLPWYADKSLMPRLISPPGPTALMSCEYEK